MLKWKRTREVILLSSEEAVSRARLVTENGVVKAVIEKPEPQEVDVTYFCTPRLVKSGSSNGHYLALYYKGTQVAILGARLPVAKTGFRVEKAEGAFISFRVFQV